MYLFLWLLLHDRLNTAENFIKKGWPAISACVLCSGDMMETADHLFSSCPFVSRVHSIISGIASQGTVPVHRDRKRACVNHNSATWAATVWGIRKERNARIFHGTSRRISLVAQEVVELAWTWRAAYNI
jgi:zinc-binding in reverse transcriptase